MWKEEINKIEERFAEAYSIPKDVVANATLFHVIGKSELYFENFKGIISYNCCEILIKGYDCKYCVCGKCLVIAYYSSEDMKITGQICEVKIIHGV